MEKSMLDLAYDYLDKNAKEPVSFADLWNYVKDTLNLTEDEAGNKISSFYTNLTLDGRFVLLGDNLWDLRNRHTFEKVHIDMKDAYNEENDYQEELDDEDMDEDESLDDNSEHDDSDEEDYNDSNQSESDMY